MFAEFEHIDNQHLDHPLDAVAALAAMQLVLDAAPDRRVTITRRFDDGSGSGVLAMTWRSTFTGADEPTVTGMVVTFDTNDDRITRQRFYYG